MGPLSFFYEGTIISSPAKWSKKRLAAYEAILNLTINLKEKNILQLSQQFIDWVSEKKKKT